MSARTAVVQHYQSQGIDITDVDDIWLGNGVSELISMALQAMLDNGDEVLVPAPDYPLWTASTSLAGGRPIHYLCDESNDWLPDLDDLAAKITPRTKAIVVINPNNPTGAVYPAAGPRADRRPRPPARAGRHGRRDLRQDPLRRRGASHLRVGRAGRVHADVQRAVEGVPVGRFPVGLADGDRPEANMPAAISKASRSWPTCGCAPMCRPSMRYRPRSVVGRASGTWCCRVVDCANSATPRMTALEAIPGVSCVRPKGALYVFPRLDPELYPISDDQQFVLELLRSQACSGRAGQRLQLAADRSSADRDAAARRRS